jgi:hypothetical protein
MAGTKRKLPEGEPKSRKQLGRELFGDSDDDDSDGDSLGGSEADDKDKAEDEATWGRNEDVPDDKTFIDSDSDLSSDESANESLPDGPTNFSFKVRLAMILQEKYISRVTFKIGMGNPLHTIQFKRPCNEREAIEYVQKYLSVPLDKEYYAKVMRMSNALLPIDKRYVYKADEVPPPELVDLRFFCRGDLIDPVFKGIFLDEIVEYEDENSVFFVYG